jgi:chromosome segregation ATPase
MASEQGDPAPLPSGIEEWIADRTAETGDSREAVLARAVASYRLLAEDADEDDVLETTLSELEARIEALETDPDPESDRIEALEAELDDHVEDLRSRIVDVVKEARSRAPADHGHAELDDRLSELEGEIDALDGESTEELRAAIEEVEADLASLDEMIEDRLGAAEGDLDSATASVETLETKADRLAGAVVDLRRRLKRVESHITHQTALAELLETASREEIEKARCDNCNETVQLGLLVEPACPHCRSAFDGIEPGSMFFKSAWLTIADRPALEAGKTTEQPFDGDKSDAQPVEDGHTHRNDQ